MKYIISVLSLLLCISVNAKTIYVANNGNDSETGEDIGSPVKTITRAISLSDPGDVIYVRGGVHTYSSSISISKSGTETDTCFLLAYPGERPVIDFSGTSFGTRGVSLKGSYWYIKGFDFKYAGDNGMIISGGGNNVIEYCSFCENQDTGLQLGDGAHDNTIINCDSYFNADPTDYGDADGFAPKLDVGSNNRFVGCRAWNNCDDGWDGYMRGATDVTTILENCWTWGNGYMKDGSDPGSQANGNGFKMGGGDSSNSANLMHHFYLSNCMSFYNKAKGFDQNNNVGTMSMLNCTGFGNETANYRIKKELASGQELIVKNCISYNGKTELGSFAVQETNSWLSSFYVDDSDFISIDTTGISAPRKEDGSLPDVDFMHLSEGSDLIDSGTDVGLAFSGSAPDLGAFEYNTETGIQEIDYQFYAYTTSEKIVIRMNNTISEPLNCNLYNINGQLISATIFNSQTHQVNWSSFNPGVYILELRSSNKRFVKKLVK